MVKIEIVKKDLFWVVPVVLLLAVSFVYSYGGTNPAIMGHSVGEIDITDEFCSRITGHACGYDNAGAVLDLVNGVHSSEQCVKVGGSVVSVSEGRVCKFSGASCASGWSRFKSYSSTSAGYCACTLRTLCDDCGGRNACSTGHHSFSNNGAVETCLYYWDKIWNAAYCDWNSPETCRATVTSVGCY